jgi:hypothetical protein
MTLIKSKSFKVFLILLSLNIALFFWIFKIGWFEDSITFLPANQLPETARFEFWIHLFTEPNAWDIQYRPLGFFGFYYFARTFFGVAIWKYHAFSIFILSLWSLLIFRITYRFTNSNVWSAFAVLAFALHYNISYIVMDVSCTAKYLLTGLLLSFGIDRIQVTKGINWVLAITLFFVCLFCLFCHEGSLTFPLIFMMFAYTFKKTGWQKLSISIVPTLIYLWARQFHWIGFQNSFMKTNFVFGSKNLFSLFSYALFPRSIKPIHMDFSFYLGLLLCSAFLIVFRFSEKEARKQISFTLAASFLLVSTFSPLIAHVEDVYFKGLSWALIFTAILLAITLQSLEKYIPRKQLLSISLVSLFFIWNGGADNVNKAARFYSKLVFTNEKILVPMIEKQILKFDSNIPITIKIEEVQDSEWTTSYGPDYLDRFYIPALLAIYFPHHTFFISNIDGCKEIPCEGNLIRNGAYHYIVKGKSPGNFWLKDSFLFNFKWTEEPIPLVENQNVTLSYNDIQYP